MLFGELKEPSTRALVEDDGDFPEYTTPSLEWDGVKKPPNKIKSLIFVESKALIKLFDTIILNKQNLISTLNDDNIRIYSVPSKDSFIITYLKKNLTTGELIIALEPWILNADEMFTFTSAALAAYVNLEMKQKPESLVRTLHTPGSKTFECQKLETPNMVTGFGADILSYCIHCNLKCSLFIIYLDSCPLDSLNTNKIVELLKQLDLNFKPFSNSISINSSNLYI